MPRRGTAPAPPAGAAFGPPPGGAFWLAGEPALLAKGASDDFHVAAADVLQWLRSDAASKPGLDAGINDEVPGIVEDVPVWCGKGYVNACRIVHTFA
eukprot:CAMPEP_0198590246 /NCGR_PEP_ID=MMETSP1462-20131121/135449_1 /TAXON_ID=1333877 /ORGANISM="Brandtodinium nutriculum, Strain RCC3387" /LENGTH=96 /DNA_ID=CAMNT_0044321781 /DNA_START=1 /DNA_END=287 /DNA_ORIENTATION=-